MVDISIIVPVGPKSIWIKECLLALLNSHTPNSEIIIVANGINKNEFDEFTDQSSLTIAQFNDKLGPAAARNYGAKLACGEFLVFVDSDVVVQQKTITTMIDRLNSLPADGVYASYSPQSRHTNFFSRYKQFLNYYMHQNSNGESSSFWGACSAIKKSTFLVVGGFDESYSKSSIEDIELGNRLKESGFKIHLLADLTVEHLKRWSLSTLIRSDIFDRAIPWSKLILAKRTLPNELNLQWRFRLSAGLAILFFPSILTTDQIEIPLSIITLYTLLNFDFYKACYKSFGLLFSIKAYIAHFAYYIYSVLSFAYAAADYYSNKLKA